MRFGTGAGKTLLLEAETLLEWFENKGYAMGKTKKFSMSKYVILALASSLASSIFAREGYEVGENVVRRTPTVIDHIEETKIYLKTDLLKFRDGRMYAEDKDGLEFAIPVIIPTDGHPYVQIGEGAFFNSWLCSCKAWNHRWDNPTHCWKCGEPRFPKAEK